MVLVDFLVLTISLLGGFDGSGASLIEVCSFSAVAVCASAASAFLAFRRRFGPFPVRPMYVHSSSDRIQYEGRVSTPTADLATIKCLLNSVVSTPNAKFMTIDISDFYLGTPLPTPEYMRISVKVIPKCIMDQYKLAGLVHNGYVMVEINKGMYGLPQAGILANDQLQAHLLSHGYKQAPHTPGLFTHETRPITFSLIVDDFGVKYVGEEHAEHLIASLQSLYKITIDWSGTKYCGLTLAWDYDARTCHMSMPGYVKKALERFQHPAPKRPQHSPYAWTAPNYGSAVQYAADEDTSEPLLADGIQRLQEIVGVFLFYARAVDSSMLPALGSLASAQSNGTKATAAAATQLLNYADTHPDATVCFRASGMGLHVHSDASYLSESKARSRIGGYFFLSDCDLTNPPKRPDPDAPPPPFNGAILVVSSILKAVMSSATEAETGGLFYNCKEATVLRQILTDMGHPQPATFIQTDNACAAGIVNDTVKQKRSKAMDMRFYWVKDRVKRAIFSSIGDEAWTTWAITTPNIILQRITEPCALSTSNFLPRLLPMPSFHGCREGALMFCRPRVPIHNLVLPRRVTIRVRQPPLTSFLPLTLLLESDHTE